MRTAAAVAGRFIVDPAYCVPRSAGRNVRLAAVEPSDCSWASIWDVTQRPNSNAPRRHVWSRGMEYLLKNTLPERRRRRRSEHLAEHAHGRLHFLPRAD